LEWSAPPDADLHDPVGWAAANPALGIRVRLDQIAARAVNDPPTVFRTEYLSQWVATMAAAVNATEWAACLDASPLGRDWHKSLGVEVSFDRQHAAVVLAATDPQGVAHLRLLHAEHRPDGGINTAALADLVRRLWDEHGAPTILLDPRSSGPLVDMVKRLFHKPADTVQVIGSGRLSGATGELLARVQSRRVAHDGDPILTGHMLAAGVKVAGDGGLVLSRKASTGPIAAAVAAALAVNGAGQPAYEAPMIWV
jgi:phage terminase large subunit-like protein